MRFDSYIRNDTMTVENITYEQFLSLMEDNLYEGVISDVKKVFKVLKQDLGQIASEMKVAKDAIIQAVKTNDVYNLLKAFGFSITKIWKSFNLLTGLVKKGLFAIFKEIADMKYMKKLNSGAMKVDELIAKYPLLSRVTGGLVAALLIYIWLNMTFIGDVDYDFDWKNVMLALSGSFSIADLFTGPQGLMLIALFATGAVISVPWLGSLAKNLIFAIIYNGYTYIKRPDKSIVREMRKQLKMVRPK